MKSIKINKLVVVYVITFIYCTFPTKFASHYSYITEENIFDNLVQATTKNISKLNAVMRCDYDTTIEENTYLYSDFYRKELISKTTIREGGEFFPEDCSAAFSTAIIVPYRQREKQLSQYLIYMHNFLRKQNIHYRIFIVEQFDNKPFNRAKLFNIGAMAAMKLEFPCLVLTDVDLMPMNLGNIYGCSKQPRHMCSSLDIFRFHLPYSGLFGGVISIQSKTYQEINGMSNLFEGWGGEDDDLFRRLKNKNIDICRFAPSHSQYTMLKHNQEARNPDRVSLLTNGHLRYNTDGLNSLIFEEKGFTLHSLFTHVLVET